MFQLPVSVVLHDLMIAQLYIYFYDSPRTSRYVVMIARLRRAPRIMHADAHKVTVRVVSIIECFPHKTNVTLPLPTGQHPFTLTYVMTVIATVCSRARIAI